MAFTYCMKGPAMSYHKFTKTLAAAYERRGVEAMKGLSKQLRDSSADAKFAARPGLKALTNQVTVARKIQESK